MSEEQAKYDVNDNTSYSGYYDAKGVGNGVKYRWIGYYDLGIKVVVDAINKKEAQEKMKEKLIEKIKKNEEAFCIFNTWEVVDEN